MVWRYYHADLLPRSAVGKISGIIVCSPEYHDYPIPDGISAVTKFEITVFYPCIYVEVVWRYGQDFGRIQNGLICE